MTGVDQTPSDFDVSRFRFMTAASGACFAGFIGMSLCSMFGWFGRPQWWWVVMLVGFGLGVWFCHREAGIMRSELHTETAGTTAASDGSATTPPALPPSLERYCTACRSPVRRGVAFCTSCGEYLGERGGYFE